MSILCHSSDVMRLLSYNTPSDPMRHSHRFMFMKKIVKNCLLVLARRKFKNDVRKIVRPNHILC